MSLFTKLDGAFFNHHGNDSLYDDSTAEAKFNID